ncbi:MAG: VTT domain-containing protein [Acidobacteria bacterium]|nr:VTT domain-containing protein [Acidobacteriota bacterium]
MTLPFLNKLASALSQILLPLGEWGLLVAALLDSSFLSLGGGVDLWFISLCLLRPAQMPLYAFSATLGSLLGCSALYFAARKGEELWLEKSSRAARFTRIHQLVERFETPVVLVAALLPPPAPFKLVVFASGVLKLRYDRFLVALLIGRSVRYFGEGWLTVRYGRQSWVWLMSIGPVILGLALLSLAVAFLVNRYRHRASAIGN